MTSAQPGQEQTMETIDLVRRLAEDGELGGSTDAPPELVEDGELDRQLADAECCLHQEQFTQAAESVHKARDRLILYREALEAITRENGKNGSGLIDWQRCVDRIQGIARAVLSRSGDRR